MADPSYVLLAVLGVYVVVVLGVALWWAWRSRRDVLRHTGLEELGWTDGNRAIRAATRGPVPTDPVERSRSAAMVDDILERRRRATRWAGPLFVGLAVLQAVLFVLEPGFTTALNVVWPVLLVVAQRSERARFTRRRAALAPPPEPATP